MSDSDDDHIDESEGLLRPPEEKVKTGWENVKEAFVYDGANSSREVLEVMLMFGLGALGGAVYGGVPAARHQRNRYIQISQASPYPSKMEATGHSYNAGTRGFIRYGFRWGWRTGLIACGFHTISTFLATYRDKTDLVNYVAAGATVGGLYKITLGLRGMIGGSLAGTLVSAPTGLLMLGLQKLAGETALEKNKTERMERLKRKTDELDANRKSVPWAVQYMEEELKKSIQDTDSPQSANNSSDSR